MWFPSHWEDTGRDRKWRKITLVKHRWYTHSVALTLPYAIQNDKVLALYIFQSLSQSYLSPCSRLCCDPYPPTYGTKGKNTNLSANSLAPSLALTSSRPPPEFFQVPVFSQCGMTSLPSMHRSVVIPVHRQCAGMYTVLPVHGSLYILQGFVKSSVFYFWRDIALYLMTGPNACVPELCSFAEIQLLAEPAVKWPTSGIPACSGKYRYPTHQEVLDAKVSASDCSSERDGRSKARALGQVRIGVLLHSFLFALLIFFNSVTLRTFLST